MPTFTGERPGRGEGFDYDESRHMAAYGYAFSLAAGKEVLDAGCGEGYGSKYLAEAAARVLGIDHSAEAVAFCKQNWNLANLDFVQLDLARPAEARESFDLVVCFQVLEHVKDDALFVAGLRQWVRPGGRLLLTTPNRLMTFSENPYHVREYTAAELRELLAPLFAEVSVKGMMGNQKVRDFDRHRRGAVDRFLRLDPLGLRRLLPRALAAKAFARLAVRVRQRAKTRSGGEDISPQDFYVSDGNVDEAMDLVALCVR